MATEFEGLNSWVTNDSSAGLGEFVRMVSLALGKERRGVKIRIGLHVHANEIWQYGRSRPERGTVKLFDDKGATPSYIANALRLRGVTVEGPITGLGGGDVHRALADLGILKRSVEDVRGVTGVEMRAFEI